MTCQEKHQKYLRRISRCVVLEQESRYLKCQVHLVCVCETLRSHHGHFGLSNHPRLMKEGTHDLGGLYCVSRLVDCQSDCQNDVMVGWGAKFCIRLRLRVQAAPMRLGNYHLDQFI